VTKHSIFPRNFGQGITVLLLSLGNAMQFANTKSRPSVWS